MHYGARESRRLQKAAALFMEDHIVGGFALGRVGEQTGLQFLPPTLSGTRPGKLLDAGSPRAKGTDPAAGASLHPFQPSPSDWEQSRRLERSVNI